MGNPQRPTMRSRKLGQRLRALREERGLTLQGAARLLHRTPSSLSKLETGKRGIRRPAFGMATERLQ
ncbi:helix-turn-helix domain-containing protein [Actinomadura welshii]|uniref:helix-turn-helix domain-containing protein n=1 Tax=Actinomadura welshii TaxID=3103817 RepID=UPI0003AD1294